MGWLDSILGGSSGGGSIWGNGVDIWSGGQGNFGGGFDWGSLWGDIGQPGSVTDNMGWLSGNGGGGIWDWASGLGNDSGAGNALGGVLGNVAKGALQGGGAQGQQQGWMQQLAGNQGLMGALLGGLQGAAGAYMNDKAMAEQGKQARISVGYAADLDDYYTQLNKQRKRVALDTYGQFSLLGNNVTPAPAIQVPGKPNPGG